MNQAERVVCDSGLLGWRARLRDVYENEAEFFACAETYGLHLRLGFATATEAWEANPIVQGSVNPSDYRTSPDEAGAAH